MPLSPPSDRISLLVSDIDGTLVTKDKRLTPEVLAAVARLREAGVPLALVSSRPPRGLLRFIEPLAIDIPCAGFNGGVLFRPGGEVLMRRPIDPAMAGIAVETMARHGADVWLFTETEWLARDPNGEYVAHEAHAIGFEPRIVPDFAPYLDHAFKIVAASSVPEQLAAAEAELHRQFDGAANASLSQVYYLDVNDAAAHKGTAAADIARALGIDLANVATIGDGANDVPMFLEAGLSIAMGNASAETKARAHVETGTNNDSGLATAIERYVLPRASRQA